MAPTVVASLLLLLDPSPSDPNVSANLFSNFSANSLCLVCQLDRWSATDLMVSPSARAGVESYLRAHGLDWSVMIPDVGAEIFREDVARVSHRTRMGTEDVLAYEQGAADFFADYHSLGDIDTFCANLASQYPELVSSKVIGHSYSGHPLTVYIVTSRKNLGAASKPAIYLESGIHAREWISHATNTYMFNAFVTGYGNDTHITSLLDNLEYHFLPVVNPDGYLRTWTTDRMSVETNKQKQHARAHTGTRWWQRRRNNGGCASLRDDSAPPIQLRVLHLPAASSLGSTVPQLSPCLFVCPFLQVAQDHQAQPWFPLHGHGSQPQLGQPLVQRSGGRNDRPVQRVLLRERALLRGRGEGRGGVRFVHHQHRRLR